MIEEYVFQFLNEAKDLPLLGSYWCTLCVPNRNDIPQSLDTLRQSDVEHIFVLLPTLQLTIRPYDAVAERSQEQLNAMPSLSLELQLFLPGPKIRIPVSYGYASTDISEWQFENMRIYARVRRKQRSGFIVDVGESIAFLPNSLVGASGHGESQSIIGKVCECEAILSECGQMPVVRPLGPFVPFEE